MPIHPNDPFKAVDFSSEVIRIPSKYGLVRNLGLFRGRGITTTHVVIAERDGVLQLLADKQRGDEFAALGSGERRMRYIKVPHFPLQARVTADSIQDVLDPATGQMLNTFSAAQLTKTEEMTLSMDMQEEWMFVGALRGQLLSYDGTTPIVNFYDEFERTQKTIDFAFSTDTTDVGTIFRNVKRHIETEISKGDIHSGIIILAAHEWFDDFISHPSVKEAYANYSAAQSALGGDNRTGFKFQGVNVIEYNGTAVGKDGASLRFIPENEAIAFPVGTMNTFDLVYSPPQLDAIQKANQLGQARYARRVPDMETNAYVTIYMEMDILPMCKRPEVLVKLTKS